MGRVASSYQANPVTDPHLERKHGPSGVTSNVCVQSIIGPDPSTSNIFIFSSGPHRHTSPLGLTLILLRTLAASHLLCGDPAAVVFSTKRDTAYDVRHWVRVESSRS